MMTLDHDDEGLGGTRETQTREIKRKITRQRQRQWS